MGGTSTTRAAILLFITASALALPACSKSDDAGTSSGSRKNPWAPTTTPFDETCSRCVELETLDVPHMGEAKVLTDPEVDDPEAQWVLCVASILDCIETGSEESACVATSSCPAPCRDEYAARLSRAGSGTLQTRWNVMAAVFMEPTAPCGIVRPAASGVAP